MFEIEEESLVLTGGRRCRFAAPIAEVLACQDVLIVRLAEDPMTLLQNVYGIDYKGRILWQIPHPLTFPLYRPYVGITTKNEQVEALNWDGHLLTLDGKSGAILSEAYYSGDTGSMPRRVHSSRHWV